ncbi:hypothetical protein UFOVP1625_16 [uncultured Caudovirales phage]|uniref:Uncharacterized protein n=1 Tax=uncultured Caudovirales phage TaxID=2100421 RepID=A0A6J5T0A2_9CAUD|nr:hypothetical protein UFOVP1625_16 [uncultured Caudovirales phage]
MAKRAGGIKIDIGANVARLSSDMNKAGNILSQFQRQANTIGKSLQFALGAAVFAGAIVGLKKLNESVLELAEAGDKASGIQAAFQKLGGTSEALATATERSKGLIEQFDLMQAANTGLIKGIPNLNEHLGEMADLAARLADAKGLNPGEVFTSLIDAVASGKGQGLKDFGIFIGDVGSKAEGTSKAVSLLGEAIKRFDPVSLGVADSVDVFKNTLSEMYKNIGIGVDSSVQLAGAFQAVKLGADPETMQRFGAALAGVEAVFVGMGTRALPVAIELLERFALGLDQILQITDQGKLTAQLQKVTDLKETRVGITSPYATFERNVSHPFMGRAIEKLQLETIDKQIAAEEAIGNKMMDDYNNKRTLAAKEFADRQQKAAAAHTQFQKDLLAKIGTGADENSTGGGKGKDPTRSQANKTILAERKAAEKELADIARAEGRQTVDEYEGQMSEAQQRLAEQMRQQQESAVQGWSGFFDKILNPQTFNAEQSLKELANGFLSELMAGLVGGLDQNKQSFFGIGRTIAEGFLQNAGEGLVSDGASGGSRSSGAGWGDLFSSFGSFFGGGTPGDGMSAADANAQGIQGPAMQDGSFGTSSTSAAAGAGPQAAAAAAIAQSALIVASAAFSAKSIDSQNKDNSGTGAAIGATLGALVAGPLGAAVGQALGSMIGGMFKWGSQEPGTIARHAFAGFIEDGFNKLERVSFFDANGKVRMYNSQNLNFQEGSIHRFDSLGDGGADWGENFKKMGEESLVFFSSLGQGFEELLGLTEDVGAQIGYLLAVNMGGNIDNARMLVYQLGISLEDMTKALDEAGRTGEMSWLEVEIALQQVNKAFEKGLVGVGDISGAFEELLGSGGRGMAALKGMRDLAIEAMENGGKSLEDLRAQLLAAGKDPEIVNAIIEAAKQRGVTNLQEFADANDRTLGGMVADTNSHSENITRSWEEMNDKVKELNQSLGELDENMIKDLTINIKTNFDGNTQQAMDEGAFSGTGAEKITSRSIDTPHSASTAQYRRSVPSGNQAKSASVVLNVDARGAERGVHSDIVSAMSIMENRIMTRTVSIIQQGAQ